MLAWWRLAELASPGRLSSITRRTLDAGGAKGFTYIWPTEPATSGHSRSISSFNRCRANDLRSLSGSDRKPTRPAAEVKPPMMDWSEGLVGVGLLGWEAAVMVGVDGGWEVVRFG